MAFTLTWGGTMSGNCATGMTDSAMRPAIEMTMEMTKASRGRRMNTAEIMAMLLSPAEAAADLLLRPAEHAVALAR